MSVPYVIAYMESRDSETLGPSLIYSDNSDIRWKSTPASQFYALWKNGRLLIVAYDLDSYDAAINDVPDGLSPKIHTIRIVLARTLLLMYGCTNVFYSSPSNLDVKLREFRTAGPVPKPKVLDFSNTQLSKCAYAKYRACEAEYVRSMEFFKAALSGEIERMSELFSLGVDPYNKCTNGWNAMHAAASTGQTDACKYLFDMCKMHENVEVCGFTPIDIARAKGHNECALALQMMYERAHRAI